jgi:hypothetical protein
VSLVIPFPTAPAQIREALHSLAVMKGGDASAIAALGDIKDTPRPWEPASCNDELRRVLWTWCDEVVAWVNHEYAWRTSSLIPSCWAAHPHIARELPALACQRLSADDSLSLDATEEWHRHTLPQFLERLSGRIGESACRNDKHVDWPAAGRFEAFRADAASAERRNRLASDTMRLQVTDE